MLHRRVIDPARGPQEVPGQSSVWILKQGIESSRLSARVFRPLIGGFPCSETGRFLRITLERVEHRAPRPHLGILVRTQPWYL